MIYLNNTQEPQRVYIPRNNDLTDVEPTEFATKAYVDGEIARVEAEIPSSHTFATKDFVEGYVYVREEIINGKIDGVEDKIPSIDGLATEDYVDNKAIFTLQSAQTYTDGVASGKQDTLAVGIVGQVLQSNGNDAPSWINLIKPQRITQEEYDELGTKDPNVLYIIVEE